MQALKKALEKAKHNVTESDNGLLVENAKTDDVGTLAFKSGLTILELTKRSASLEEAFLELTASSQEFKTGGTKGDN
jgi:ABC-2 type transport system ATP-binding protein